MSLTLYNTLTREKQTFEPGDPQRVTMYVCGPTVYNYAHIGNARPVVVFDVLYRLLQRQFPKVIYARNITDVDDKIIEAAAASGVPIDEVTERFTEAYNEDMAGLGALAPDLTPRATENMAEMIAMIQTLIAGGHAYEAEGHVLFAVSTDAQYGGLSRRSARELLAGARVEVASYKKDPGDFVLWKPSSPEQPAWDSPWGRGRPGWHLECSAMVSRHLGHTIDIHGGGIDLVFPHHENELAQSRCAHGEQFVRYWMHNGFLTLDRDKMSKSEGNVLTVRELLARHPGEVLRLTLLSAHYRQPLDWSDEVLAQQHERLDRMYRALDRLGDIEPESRTDDAVPAAVIQALEDDLNTPQALAELSALVNRANSSEDEAELGQLKSQILAAGELLGLLQEDADSWLKGGASEGPDPAEVEQIVAARNAAREARDFARADELRDQLAAMGVAIEDGPEGTRWRVAR